MRNLAATVVIAKCNGQTTPRGRTCDLCLACAHRTAPGHEAMGWTVYRITGRDCFSNDVESEDESGHTVITPSTARKFIERISGAHNVRRHRIGRPEGAVWIGDAMVRAMERMVEGLR